MAYLTKYRNLNVTNNANVGNVNASNVANADTFIGNGAGLSTLTGANVVGQVGNALVAGTVYLDAQPNITSLGTLVSLTVDGQSDLGDVSNVKIAGGANGYVLTTDGTGNLSWSGTPSISVLENGNSNVVVQPNGNVVMSITGVDDVMVVSPTGTELKGNITLTGSVESANVSTGELVASGNLNVDGNINGNGTVTVSGDATVGNLSTVGVTASGNVSAGNITVTGVATVTGDITTSGSLVSDRLESKTGEVTIAATGTNANVTLLPAGTGLVDVGGAVVANLANPTNDYEAATKYYVDQLVQGFKPQRPVVAATTGPLGGTYDNGDAGVGATLTFGTPVTVIDGYTLTVGDRVLVKNQANGVENGPYVVTSGTVFTRAEDDNTPAKLPAGSFFFVDNGVENLDTAWVTITDIVTIGVTPIEFFQVAAPGTYTAGTGLDLTGTVFSIADTAVTAGAYGNGTHIATFTVNQQGQLTAADAVPITPAGVNGQIQFNDSGVLGADAGLTFNKATDTLTVLNVVTDTIAASGSNNLTLTSTAKIVLGGGDAGFEVDIDSNGIAVTGGVTATANITGLNILTSGVVQATGNILGDTVIASGNINTITGSVNAGNVNVTGNVDAGNVTVSGTTNLGAVENVVITGGSDGQVLSTDGTGNLSWVYGGSRVAVNVQTGTSYSIAPTDQVVAFDNVGNVNVTLPTPEIGRQIIIKDILGEGRADNPITISVSNAGTENIDGQTSFELADSYNGIVLIGITATQWIVM